MITNPTSAIEQQWRTLHNNIECYEQYALLIKLVAAALTVISIQFSVSALFIIFVLGILWLQEGIWKTYQGRLNNAIMKIEILMSDKTNGDATVSLVNQPLYSDWQSNRPNSAKLINEYISNALKPTVIFPYVPLMITLLIFK
jgi:hypothetical protein